VRTAKILTIAFGVLVLLQVVLLRPYRIPSSSMVPTFRPGDRVLALLHWYGLVDPGRGDIVVFHPNGLENNVFRSRRASTRTFVKRVVALPGETAGSVAGHVYICRRGVRPGLQAAPDRTPGCTFLAEPYARGLTFQCSADRPYGPETVPADQYLLLGDNRADSEDSRCFGTVRRAQIVGRVLARYWPFGRIGTP
jgi:signal peptidase I